MHVYVCRINMRYLMSKYADSHKESIILNILHWIWKGWMLLSMRMAGGTVITQNVIEQIVKQQTKSNKQKYVRENEE